MQVVVREVDGGAGAICNDILRLLPTWFRIPEANRDYVDTAETHPGIVARFGDEGLELTDRILLTVPEAERDVADRHGEWIAREVLAIEVLVGGELAIEKT